MERRNRLKSDRVKQALTRAAGRYTTGALFKGAVGDSCANANVCAQGALWAFMTNGRLDGLRGDTGSLQGHPREMVCDFYDLDPKSVDMIPCINDKNRGDTGKQIDIPTDVYAWLEFHHENPRMIGARKIIQWVKGHRHGLNKIECFQAVAGKRVAQINNALFSALNNAAIFGNVNVGLSPSAVEIAWELLTAAVTGEEKPQLPTLRKAVEKKLIPRRILKEFLALPHGPGWDKGRKCVLRELTPDLKRNIAKGENS